jgi:hypothetical protein
MILNDSREARLRREGALILVECKNWRTKCRRSDFSVFQSKLANRYGRCTLGFLISWNGFTSTITREMLRGNYENILIVPMTGADIRTAVRDGNFATVMLDCWQRAVTL